MRINFQVNNIFLKKQNNKVQNNNMYAFGVQNPFLAPLNKDTVQISFGDKRCSESKFELKEITNLRCPACGLIMLNDREINAFADDIANKKGAQLSYTLELYEDDTIFTNKKADKKTTIFRPTKQEVVDIIEDLAIEFPDKDLLELVKIQAQRSIDKLIENQMNVIYELEDYIEKNITDSDEQTLFRHAMKEYINQIKGESEERFSRKRFIYGIKMKTDDLQKRQEIEDIASKMPTSENDADSFFVKYSTRAETPRDVALKLVNQSIPTAEHIVPASKGGPDRLSNYLCDCADCNSRRSNIDFYDWAKSLDGFEQRLQEYVDEIQKHVDADKFSKEYDDYNAKLISTIYTQSRGEIILGLPDSNNPKKMKAELEKRKREVEKITLAFQQAIESKKQLEYDIKRIEANKVALDKIKTYSKARSILNDINQSRREKVDELTALQNSANILKAKIKKADQAIKADENDKKTRKLKEAKPEYERELNEINASIAILNQEIEKHHEKNQRCHRIIDRSMGVFEEVNNRIKKYQNILNKVAQIEREIEENNNEISREKEIRENLASVLVQIKHLENENKKILSITAEEFDVENDFEYSLFRQNQNLLTVAKKILDDKINVSKFDPQQVREIIKLARDVLEERVEEAKGLDSIMYFSNANRIKALNKDKNKYENTLNKIEQTKQANVELRNQLEQICCGLSIAQIREQLDYANKEKEALNDALELPKKKEELEKILSLISRNGKLVDKIQKYRTISAAQYQQTVSRITLKY